MKDVLHALANLLHEMNGEKNMPPRLTLLTQLEDAVVRAPGPRVRRLIQILELLATDATR